MVLKRNFLIIFLLLFSFSTIAQTEEKKDGFKIGGAVRYNVLSTNYENSVGKLSPQITWDTWRLNVDGSMSGIDLSFEYRFYPTYGTHFIHHGYLGYAFSDNVYMKLGVSQVPFGITKYASHSWWFQGAYYVGLEDDYDMGIKFDLTPAENIELSLAYYRQAEPEGPKFGGDVTFGNAGPGRYSYDIVPGNGAFVNSNGEAEMAAASLRELNQVNARLAWHFHKNWEMGVSAQVGGIYNSVLDDSETSTAFAGHLVGDFGRFNLKTEIIHYNYRAKSDDGRDLDVVQMGAYGYEYFSGDGYTGGVAAKANIYVAGIAYTIPVEWGPVSSIQPYVDYTLIDKAVDSFADTQHLVPGFLISAGPVYTYVDYAMGKNQPWLTSSFGKGLGSGVEDADWNTRFNINVGYYF
ncbi:hypothetical protein SAMN05444274_104134 [Mariniphaga anaerophila]|uniref:Phosphate-selective porin O and P n=1 Tax=Mariniphaga anaerophila TaxID=1484053 RepID=A0A1M5A0I8_9BACT|nr:hypothetical protein [Mariniphaga anaerophila]SHF23789.1 hypothetical protein SAMN05444274_104134 [Mariniphaga anaerophila]